MNRPINFRKINNTKFTTSKGYEYTFSTNGVEPELWVFRFPDNTNNVLAFIMIWEYQRYEIRKAGNGKGTNWIDTLHKGCFDKATMKTMDSFTDWVKDRIEHFESQYE